jgi:putative hydrolase of the HAD superfamily
MIGDNLDTDVKGAVNAGIDHVLFNPDKIVHNEKVMHEIHNLTELKAILIKE